MSHVHPTGDINDEGNIQRRRVYSTLLINHNDMGMDGIGLLIIKLRIVSFMAGSWTMSH
jgi:hypothetical protein